VRSESEFADISILFFCAAQPGTGRDEAVAPGCLLQVYHAPGPQHDGRRHGDVGSADLVAPSGAEVSTEV
jgi:hypothetical protein